MEVVSIGEFVERYGDAMKWIAADDVRDFIEGCEDVLEDGCFPFTVSSRQAVAISHFPNFPLVFR